MVSFLIDICFFQSLILCRECSDLAQKSGSGVRSQENVPVLLVFPPATQLTSKLGVSSILLHALSTLVLRFSLTGLEIYKIFIFSVQHEAILDNSGNSKRDFF